MGMTLKEQRKILEGISNAGFKAKLGIAFALIIRIPLGGENAACGYWNTWNALLGRLG